MKTLKTILLLVFVSNLFAQNSTTNTQNFRTGSYTGKLSSTGTGFWVPAKTVNNEITGSDYLFDNWIGNYNVYDSSGNKHLITNLNYNLNTNTLESKVSNDSVFQFDLINIKKVTISNKSYDVVDSKLYEVFFSSEKFNVYKQYSVSISEATLNPLTQENITERKYIKKSKFLVKRNDLVEEFKINKKNILSLFDTNQNDVKKYVKDNQLSYSSENDLTKILRHFSSL